MRDRITRVRAGRYRIRLRANETMLVQELMGQLRDQLTASTDAPVVRRLFPPAYPDDQERDAGYQVLTRDELLESKLATIATVESMLAKGRTDTDADREELTAWMQALNSLRLVLGTRLDVDEELPELDADDPDAPAYAVYEFLGWLLSQIVDVLALDLPPGDPDADPATPPPPAP